MSGKPVSLEYLEKITAFLSEIGISWRFGEIHGDSFLSGVQIYRGTLVIDTKKLKYPGDVLHEAGHLAIEPEISRAGLTDNVRECGQGDAEEMAAIAWSYAALKAISIPPNVVFHEEGYKGASESILTCFETGGTLGQPLLSYYGMCSPGTGPDGFPNMSHWLRPAALN
ncbi:hypothetical protein [Planctobacterium marinum]|uniref:Uncharacterized protein n=1 Tax=Planctobacterium marinum TaxID=1631968 RepID=A0AA48I0A9_9ALTE|nr:hypothetical protein MACH26_34210 [Planctobacterium marinum]